MRDFAIVLGSGMLATGVCSPGLPSINPHCAELVFFGLALIISTLWADYKTERD